MIYVIVLLLILLLFLSNKLNKRKDKVHIAIKIIEFFAVYILFLSSANAHQPLKFNRKIFELLTGYSVGVFIKRFIPSINNGIIKEDIFIDEEGDLADNNARCKKIKSRIYHQVRVFLNRLLSKIIQF